MEINRLGNWEKSERKALARRLRRTLTAASGPEERLWKELLRRLEESEEAIKPEEAVIVMQVQKNYDPDLTVNSTASHLRAKVKNVSHTLIPDPGVYLSKQKYAIQVTQDPPPGWKQSVGPSIGILLADAADWFVGKLIQGVVQVSNKHGHDLIVDVSNDDPVVEARKLRHLLERTHGVLIVPASDTALDPASRQLLRDHDCVLVDRYLRDLRDVPCIHPDDISAGRRAALYLKERACDRVLIVDQGSRLRNSFVITALEDRARGCQMQLGDDAVVCHLRAAGSDEQGGFDALQDFEENEPLRPSDGIFALTDRLALGCRHYLLTRPQPLDLALISVEGQPFGDFVKPPLISIEFDIVEMGRQAARVLFAKLQEGDMPESDCKPHFLISPTLLRTSEDHEKRQSIPISFPDAASYYSDDKIAS